MKKLSVWYLPLQTDLKWVGLGFRRFRCQVLGSGSPVSIHTLYLKYNLRESRRYKRHECVSQRSAIVWIIHLNWRRRLGVSDFLTKCIAFFFFSDQTQKAIHFKSNKYWGKERAHGINDFFAKGLAVFLFFFFQWKGNEYSIYMTPNVNQVQEASYFLKLWCSTWQ